MFTLASPHIYSLILAFSFAITIHFALIGFTKKINHFFLFFSLFPFCLMALTLILPQIIIQVLAYLFLSTGLVISSYYLPKRYLYLKNWLFSLTKKEFWLIFAVGIYLLSFFMSATVLGGSGLIQDALVYHLEGPKEWALYLNGAKFNANNPITYTTSYYDYYYYFLILILKPLFIYFSSIKTTQYEFLAYTMVLSAQIFTAIIGLLYAPVLILRFAKNLGWYKYLTIFFIFGLRDLTWSWVLPKNDPFSFICFLLGISLFYNEYIAKENNENKLYLFLAATIVGIGTASKLTNSYVVLFSLFFCLAFYYKSFQFYLQKIGLVKAILIITTGLGLGVSVLLLRNILQTGNPFYPIAKFGFTNTYLSEYADRPQLYNLPGDWTQAIVKIKSHLIEQPQLILLFIAAMFYKQARFLALFYICMVVYMAKETGPMFRYRMTTIFLILALILFMKIVEKFKKNIALVSILIIIVILTAKIQIEKIIKIPSRNYTATTGEVVKLNVDYWDDLLKSNLLNCSNDKFVYSPEKEIFPFFSRFPFISKYDSVPKYRYEYFKTHD